MPNKWVLFLTALLSPMFLWALLAIVARRRPGILPALYPWLKVLCWILWGCALALMSMGLLAYPKFPPLWALVVPFYFGLNLMRGWVQRRVDPGSCAVEPSHGWWPSPKDY